MRIGSFMNSKGPVDGIRRRAVASSKKKDAILPSREAVVERVQEEGIIITETLQGASASPAREARLIPEDARTFSSWDSSAGWGSARKKIFGKIPKLMWMGAVSGAGIAVLFAILGSTVFARVMVKIKPRVESVTLEGINATLDTAASRVIPEGGVIPAERLEFSRTHQGEFEATGQKFIEEKSRGKAKIYNSFSSSPQPLAARTRFLTASGMLFRLPRSLTVPGAKIEGGKIVPMVIETELVADIPGEQGNISGEVSLRILGFKGSPKYDGFYALAPQGFSGGLKAKARVISESDRTKAQEQVTKQAVEMLNQEMARKVPPRFTWVEPLREVRITKVEVPDAGVKADRFSVKSSTIGRAFVFREEDVLSLLKAAALKGEGKRDVIPGSMNLQYQVRNINFDKGKAEIMIRGALKTKRLFSEQELAELLKGKKEGSLLEVLKTRSELASFSVSFFPPWIFRAPADAAKIKFVVEEP